MKRSLLMTILLIWPALGVANDADNIKLVTTGRVVNVDAKHKTFQFAFRLDQPPQFNRQANRQPYPGGRGRRGRIGGYPGGYPGRRGGNLPPDDTKEVKVFVSDATRLKTGGGSMQFSDLKTGDRITITAVHKGHGDDLEAYVVSR